MGINMAKYSPSIIFDYERALEEGWLLYANQRETTFHDNKLYDGNFDMLGQTDMAIVKKSS